MSPLTPKLIKYVTLFFFFTIDGYCSPKIGVVVSVFNRPEYLEKTLNDLQEKIAGNHLDLELLIIDDCSTDPKTKILLDNFHYQGQLTQITMPKNSGIGNVLSFGWKLLKDKKCDFLCNIDSDVALKDYWLEKLLDTYKEGEKIFGASLIITGFHTKNHPIKEVYPSFYIKKSVGGINLFFPATSYPLVKKALRKGNAWDWALVDLATQSGYRFLCTRPSVIQHIGQEGMNSTPSHFNYAEDF